jgi:2-polyprenyl-6-methoxyphenol hydroxylase-like FAD-dependent oxidoreductase
VVGARCAGATLALELARAGWRVALVDRYRFPNDTVSTHVMFPNTLARLDQLGVLDRLQAKHDIRLLWFSFCALGHEVAGEFTAIDGHDRASCVRRSVLAATLLSTALAAGAEPYLGRPLTSLLGDGSDDDPVRGWRSGALVASLSLAGRPHEVSVVGRGAWMPVSEDR